MMDETSGENYVRLHFLCYNAAPTFLRGVFHSFWKAVEGEEWGKSSGRSLLGLSGMDSLIQGDGKVRRIQRDKLEAGNVGQWDLPLLVDILKVLKRDHPKVRVSSCDLSKLTLKNLETLKSTRNLLAHAGSTEMDTKTFQRLWNDMARILTSIGMDERRLERPVEVKVTSNGMVERSKTAEECNARGSVKFKEGRFWDAVTDFSAGIAAEELSDELLGTLYANRSLALLKAGHIEEALDDAHSAVDLRPAYFRGYELLGQTYQKTNQFVPAKFFYRLAIQNGDTSEKTALCVKVCQAMVDKFVKSEGTDEEMMKTMDYGYNLAREYVANFLEKGYSVDETLEGTPYLFCHLGQRCYWGAEGCPVDYKKAAEYFAEAARMGDAEGLYNLGMMTREGKGVERNPLKGHGLLLQAASKETFVDFRAGPKVEVEGPNVGVMKAAHSLGMAYQFGTSVGIDKAEALKWYSAAVEFGCEMSANNIGVIYDNGNPGDFQKALDYWKLSGYLGSLKGIKNLTEALRERGELKEADGWLQYALHSGEVDFQASKDVYLQTISLDDTFDPEKFKLNVGKYLEASRLSRLLEKIKQCKRFEAEVPEQTLDKQEEVAGRIGAILRHRELLSATRTRMKKKRVEILPSKSTKSLGISSAVTLEGLRQIFFKDMKEETVYVGRLLMLRVIEDVVYGNAVVGLLVEDDNGDVKRLFVSNYPQRKETHEEIGYGCRLSLIYPHYMPMTDGLRGLYVDEPQLLFRHLRNPDHCRYCGKAEGAVVECRKCRRVKYCSKLCLKKDAQILKHSLVCFKSL